MEKNLAIKVENISKVYAIGQRVSYQTLRESLASLPKRLFSKEKTKEFWALKDISFEINKGEIVGIIGKNGAGKSTLLKILSRITEPTTGTITMKGKVASLLEVGTGFNPELTGRENIFLNGSIIGMTKKEINQKFDEIVRFSGVKKFLDTPVKRYSSGMYVRLAFAVAAHLESDILLVDEVLAVGDIEFQKKCLGKMGDLAKSGRTIVFVSHSLDSVRKLCSRTILVKEGKVEKIGKTQEIINAYLKTQSQPKIDYQSQDYKASKIKLVSITVNYSTSKNTDITSNQLGITTKVKLEQSMENIGFGMGIMRMDGVSIYTLRSTKEINRKWEKGDYQITVYTSNNLKPGIYMLSFGAFEADNKPLIYYHDAAKFEIPEKQDFRYEDGFIDQDSSWEITKRK